MTTFTEFNAILARHQRAYPVQTVPLAHGLGIKVYRAHGFPDNISGRIYQESAGNYAIDVNATHHPNRRRFTIAHEIAHYMLHRDLIGQEMFDDYMYRSGLSNSREYEANSMAADILMPRHLIDLAKQDGLTGVQELASAFQVSERSMRIRIGG